VRPETYLHRSVREPERLEIAHSRGNELRINALTLYRVKQSTPGSNESCRPLTAFGVHDRRHERNSLTAASHIDRVHERVGERVSSLCQIEGATCPFSAAR